MKNIIVGTAGHVDHGKTCLIKALTGTDTDRLKEEKKRGITIELGFAQLPNDQNLDVGIVDVPGHEKFVRHMLAGIGGIDIVLLIIAADEGIMPQTREHFEILKMLEIKQGIVVITKTDMVDEEWMELIRGEISEYVRGTFMEGSPTIEVSSYTGQNIKELRQLICKKAESCKSRREDRELLRLPIDRVFTIDGFGTVVTGTLMEGAVEVGDEVSLYPHGKKARVRKIQVHGQTVEIAQAGQRTAINITGIKKEEIRRGDVIATTDSLQDTMMLDVRIDMFDDIKRKLKNGSRVHIYYGSAEALCKVVLLEDDALDKGQRGYAQLRLEEGIAVRREDRFILRFYSPLETIGGGVILNSHPPKRKRFNEKSINVLKIQDKGEPRDVLEEILKEESGQMLTIRELARAYGGTLKETESLISILTEEERVKRICENLYLHIDFLNEIGTKARRILSKYHNDNPLKAGMPKEEFRMKLKDVLRISSPKYAEHISKYLIADCSVKENTGFICLPDFKAEYTDEQKKLAEFIIQRYRKAGVQPEDRDSIIDSCRDKKLAADVLETLVGEKVITRLTHQYYIYTEALNNALKMMINKLDNDNKITLGEFRDLIGASRKYSMMILEYADSKGITIMTGEARVLRK